MPPASVSKLVREVEFPEPGFILSKNEEFADDVEDAALEDVKEGVLLDAIEKGGLG